MPFLSALIQISVKLIWRASQDFRTSVSQAFQRGDFQMVIKIWEIFLNVSSIEDGIPDHIHVWRLIDIVLVSKHDTWNWQAVSLTDATAEDNILWGAQFLLFTSMITQEVFDWDIESLRCLRWHTIPEEVSVPQIASRWTESHWAHLHAGEYFHMILVWAGQLFWNVWRIGRNAMYRCGSKRGLGLAVRMVKMTVGMQKHAAWILIWCIAEYPLAPRRKVLFCWRSRPFVHERYNNIISGFAYMG